MLLFAGAVATLPLVTVVRRPMSAPRLVVEAFVTVLAAIGVFWLGWVALWPLEQRWSPSVAALSQELSRPP